MENNIIWIVGGQGTGKTTFANFLKFSHAPFLKVFDGFSREVESYLYNKIMGEFQEYKFIIFSNKLPPKTLRGIEFKPLVYDFKIKSEYTIKDFFDTYFMPDSDNKIECILLHEIIDKLLETQGLSFEKIDIVEYLNDNYNHTVKLSKKGVEVFFNIKVK